MLVPIKAKLTAEKQSCKFDIVNVKGFGNIHIILALFKSFFNGLQV